LVVSKVLRGRGKEKKKGGRVERILAIFPHALKLKEKGGEKKEGKRKSQASTRFHPRRKFSDRRKGGEKKRKNKTDHSKIIRLMICDQSGPGGVGGKGGGKKKKWGNQYFIIKSARGSPSRKGREGERGKKRSSFRSSPNWLKTREMGARRGGKKERKRKKKKRKGCRKSGSRAPK